MIGLDTNVLVRYITQDEPGQSERATRLIETHCTAEQPGHVTLVVLCELVWVLRGAYRYDKGLVLQVLDAILHAAEFVVEREDVAHQALSGWRDGSADFADYVIVSINHAAGCDRTFTLDRRLSAHERAQLLSQ
ncbi:MAG: type II toxin-antitoxin system VapC family toxin [Ectothiorhodospiraceae bacterium]